MLRILTPVTGRQQYSKLHCAPNSRLTYYSDSRMYRVCPVVEFGADVVVIPIYYAQFSFSKFRGEE